MQADEINALDIDDGYFMPRECGHCPRTQGVFSGEAADSWADFRINALILAKA